MIAQLYARLQSIHGCSAGSVTKLLCIKYYFIEALVESIECLAMPHTILMSVGMYMYIGIQEVCEAQTLI